MARYTGRGFRSRLVHALAYGFEEHWPAQRQGSRGRLFGLLQRRHAFDATTSGGTWTNISGNLANLPPHTVVNDNGVGAKSPAVVVPTTNRSTNRYTLGTHPPPVEDHPLAVDLDTGFLRVGA